MRAFLVSCQWYWFPLQSRGFIPSCEWPMNNFFISYIVVNFNEQLFYFLLMLITPQGKTKNNAGTV